ncbi:alpha/beta hydrolase family protein [Nonomuraea sp. M3C6]|uniref:Alpha/beta hydrolase family protein n=1 Tax=Nonomuraea marmarensis TaxID=3351344 RepID=A0ABW7AU30_9ACTN
MNTLSRSLAVACAFLAVSGSVAVQAVQASGADPAIGVLGTPFPSERWTVPDPTQLTGRRVALPKPDCARQPSGCRDVAVLNRLDGFNLQPRLSIRFTGSIAVSSVSNSDVFLVRLRGGDRSGSRVLGINQIVWDPTSNTLHAEPDQFLDQDSTYALVVTTDVRDSHGRRIAGGGFSESDKLGGSAGYAPEGTGRGRDALRGAPAYHRELLKALPIVRRAAGVDPTRVASVTVFTTQSVTALMEKIRRQLDAAPPSPARFDIGPDGTRAVFSFPTVTGISFNRQLTTHEPTSPSPVPIAALNNFPGSVGKLAFGSYRSPDYRTAAGVIPQVGTRTGTPTVQSTNTVYFNLVIPSGPRPAGGWPVAIFGHGFGDSKNNSPYLAAPALAHAGIAMIAINVAGHGLGPGGTLTVSRADGVPVTFSAGGRAVDQDGNGAFDSTEGVNASPPDTLIFNRDGLNQTTIDLMRLVRTIEAGVDIDGDGRPDLSRSKPYYFGQSFGGIYGTELLGLDPQVRTGVLNVGGGPIIEIGRLAPVFRPLIEQRLTARTPSLLNGGVDGFTEDVPLRDQPPVTSPAPGSLQIQTFLDDMEWASQSSNPVAWAPHLRLAPLAGMSAKNVIVQFARGDKTVPNPTTSAVIMSGHLEDRTTLFRNDLAFAADPTVPKDPHIFLTRLPPLAGPSSLTAQIARQTQNQIATFFLSDGAKIIDPDGVGPLFETPIRPPLPESLGFIP